MELNFNIFISHDSKDEVIAIELKSFLENIFLNASVYVSGRDLEGGQTWIENIKLRLKSSQVIISIISKESINNNWIYFETGAGFTDDKSIPLITDNLKFSDLHPPMSLLQARTITEKGMEYLISDISKKVGLRMPKVLTGIEKLLAESEKFLALRQTEKLEIKNEIPKISLKQPLKNIHIPESSQNIDPEIETNRIKAEQRALQIFRKQLLEYKGKFEMPSEDELNMMDFNKLQNIAIGYNIPWPSMVITNLMLLRMDAKPLIGSPKWEKQNFIKRIEDVNIELNRFEKVNFGINN